MSRKPTPENTYAIPLPSLYKFRGNVREGVDPITKLQYYLIGLLGYEVADAAYRFCIWHQITDKQFEKICYKYYRKTKRYMSAKLLKRHLPFILFDSPVPYKYDWMKPNMLYIRKEDVSEEAAKVLGSYKVLKEFDQELEELIK
jgi:hypothetical protein